MLCITVLYWFQFIMIMSTMWLCPLGDKVQYESAGNVFMVQKKKKSIISPRFLEWDGFYWSTACMCPLEILSAIMDHIVFYTSFTNRWVGFVSSHKNDWTFHYKGQGKCLGTPIINVTKVSSSKNFTNL